jgi:hypothetical protein
MPDVASGTPSFVQGYLDLSCMVQGEVTASRMGVTVCRLSRTGQPGPGAPGLAVATAADGQLARPHPGVLKTAAVVVPQTRRVAGRPSISGENHHVAPAVTAPESEISLAQEQTTTCYADRK